MVFVYFWPCLLAVTFFYIYIPLANVQMFKMAPMDFPSILVSLAFAVVFYLLVEGLKVIHRAYVNKDLTSKVVMSRLAAAGESVPFLRKKTAIKQFGEEFNSDDRI